MKMEQVKIKLKVLLPKNYDEKQMESDLADLIILDFHGKLIDSKQLKKLKIR